MKKVLALIGALAVSSFGAHAATMTFEPLAQAGTSFQAVGSSYSEAGFTVTSASANGMYSAQTGNVGGYFGSTSLFENSFSGAVTLTESGGSAFALNSIDLAPVATFWPAGATVTFSGALNGGGTVSQSFTLDNTYIFQTFFFTGFSNLLSVSWTQDFPYHQFDNIVLNSAAVPEPGALALVALALVGMAALRRKQG